MVSDHPMKDELSNHPTDGKWYAYRRFMVEDPEFFNAVYQEKISAENIWYPDMADYGEFVKENSFGESSQQAPEGLVDEQVPVQIAETTSESQSQTPPTHLRTVDLETGELFELPPEEEDETDDYYGEV